jgi:polypeptide N-acetylgalactosaminyltransferase
VDTIPTALRLFGACSINPETFDPQAGGIGCTLGFIWNLIEHGLQTQKQEVERRKHGIPA